MAPGANAFALDGRSAPDPPCTFRIWSFLCWLSSGSGLFWLGCTPADLTWLSLAHHSVSAQLCLTTRSPRDLDLTHGWHMAYRAECLEGLFRDEGSIEAEEEDGCIGQHPAEDDEVVHVRA